MEVAEETLNETAFADTQFGMPAAGTHHAVLVKWKKLTEGEFGPPCVFPAFYQHLHAAFRLTTHDSY